MNHTHEPWKLAIYHRERFGLDDEIWVVNKEGNVAICQLNKRHMKNAGLNAERIASCVNACAGYPDPENLITGMNQQIISQKLKIKSTEKHRNKLLKALEDTTRAVRLSASIPHPLTDEQLTAVMKVIEDVGGNCDLTVDYEKAFKF